MADNITIQTGIDLATDDVGGGTHVQLTKIDVGANGISTLASAAAPLPVETNAQYLEGETDASIEGIPILWEDTSDTLRVPSAAKPLPVAIISGAGSGGTAMADDAAFTVGTTSVTPVGGVYQSGADSVNDGDVGAFRMTADRIQYVHIAGDDVGSAVADEDGSVPRGNTNVAMVITAPYEDDGSALVRVRGPHTVAHDAADAGNPEKLGAVATSSLSALTPVTTGDRTNVFSGTDGVIINRPHCNLEDIVRGNNSNTDGSSTQVIAAQAAGIKTYLTTIILTNTHASTDGYVEIKDGTTVMVTIPVPHASGAIVNFAVPLGGTAATAWNFDPSAAISTIICSMIGFKSKV